MPIKCLSDKKPPFSRKKLILTKTEKTLKTFLELTVIANDH